MSKIPWCDVTINPIVGCTKISDACLHCYAEKTAARLCHALPQGQTRDAYRSVIGEDGRWNGNVARVESGMEKLRKLAGKRVKPKRVFVGSMTDIFHESVDVDARVELFDSLDMVDCDGPGHMLIALTKRPHRIGETLFNQWFDNPQESNIWLGVTAENQARFDERVSAICDPASPSYWPGKKFVSVEPCLEEVNCGKWLGHEVVGGAPDFIGDKHACTHYWQQHISWVIAGTESGPNRRPADPDWFRSLRDQCQAAGVPFFLKQIEQAPSCEDDCPPSRPGRPRLVERYPCDGRSGCPRGMLLVEMPYLDGRQWAEFPDGMIGGN